MVPSSKKHKTSSSVKIIDLCHRYENRLAVDSISFEIESGTIFGLIGPNGAGKSTTIKMLTTLLPPTSGEAYVNGYSIIEQPALVRESIGYVPQLISADGELTGYENLQISSKLQGISHLCRSKRIDEVLAFMDLTIFKDKLASTYSGGMIRRLEIAQALIHKPQVLFLDEPTVGLDPAARQEVWKHIRDLNKKTGTTILMTTHDMDEADVLCDNVALMYAGQIIVLDTPDNLKLALGPQASLDDVFILHTGSSLKETQDYQDVRQTRRNISNL